MCVVGRTQATPKHNHHSVGMNVGGCGEGGRKEGEVLEEE